MKYTDFTEAYILLMVKDLLKGTKIDLKKVSKRLGLEVIPVSFMLRRDGKIELGVI